MNQFPFSFKFLSGASRNASISNLIRVVGRTQFHTVLALQSLFSHCLSARSHSLLLEATHISRFTGPFFILQASNS